MSRLGGRFVLEREIGSGGMASVHLGTDEVLERRIAVKVLKPEFQESDVGARFRREGRTAARLSHPNIVQVFDAGEDDLDGRRVSYIVMEHVPGGDLRQMIAGRGALSTAEVSGLSGIAAGLAHAHERGVVHRDIKPHNILLTDNGQPKLTDFGIARALDATQFTQTGMYLGTARYSSPEQLQGEKTTAKSDVYSLGITLYEAVTGAPPFSGTPVEIATQHVSKPPTPPGEFAQVDEYLQALILDCISKSPEDRPDAASVEQRLKDLTRDAKPTRQNAPAGAMAQASTGPAPTRATSAAPTRVGADRRVSRRVPAAVGVLAVLALLGVIGAYVFLGGGEDRAAQTPAPTTQPIPQTANQAPSPGPRTVAGPTSEPNTDQTTTRRSSSSNSSASQRNGAEQPAQVTRNVYTLAADGDYGQSYDLLSRNFKQSQAPTEAQWSSQFGTLRRISFLEGPDVQVSGDTARATGVTRAVHTDRTERNTVTWNLVKENGRWKLDDVNIRDQEIVG